MIYIARRIKTLKILIWGILFYGQKKLRKTSETCIYRFRFVWTFISYTSFGMIVYSSFYLQKKHLFFPRFILFILLSTNWEDHQTIWNYSNLFGIYIMDTQMLEAISKHQKLKQKESDNR